MKISTPAFFNRNGGRYQAGITGHFFGMRRPNGVGADTSSLLHDDWLAAISGEDRATFPNGPSRIPARRGKPERLLPATLVASAPGPRSGLTVTAVQPARRCPNWSVGGACVQSLSHAFAAVHLAI